MSAYEVILSAPALADLEQLEDFIAEHAGERIATEYTARIRAKLATLAAAPFRGTERPEIGKGFRSFGFEKRATILVRVERGAKRVTVAGVFYGGRKVRLREE
ncbi:MAG: type II toxin-antitoxin system RelE/ParE family toxin [Caulobacterales bacterium]